MSMNIFNNMNNNMNNMNIWMGNNISMSTDVNTTNNNINNLNHEREIKVYVHLPDNNKIVVVANLDWTASQLIDKIKDSLTGSVKDLDLRFYYNGIELWDTKTLFQQGINHLSTIFANVGSGITGGGCAEELGDPTKHPPKKIKAKKDGPSYRTVSGGINIFGKCYNDKCIAYKKDVCHMFGYGTFDLLKDKDPDSPKCPRCPICHYRLNKINTCGFMNCYYRYIGQKVENGQIVPVNYNSSVFEPNTVDYILTGKEDEYKSTWVELKIIAEKKNYNNFCR